MKLEKFSISTILPTVLMVLLALIISGCSTSSDEDATANLRVESVTASPSSIEAGASSVIEARITNNGEALANRLITFSVPLAYGAVTPAVDTSDENGIVATVFTAAQAGTAVITVTLSDIIYNTVTVTINEAGGTGPSAGNIEVIIAPVSILANGNDSALVTVTVRDASSNPAPDGTIIKLVAGEKFDDIDGNGYFTSGVDTVVYDVNSNNEWDPNGSIASTAAVSGGAGQVSLYYYAGTFAATVYIKVTVDEVGYAGFNEGSLQLTPDAAIASIVMISDSSHLAVKRTGGLETATLRAIGYDANGNRVPEGLPITYIITDGPDDTDDGEHLADLTGANRRGPYVTITNSLGMASCPISSGTVSGTIRIRAYSDTVLSNATQILVHAGPAARIVVGAEECNVPFWGWINRINRVTALVSDIYNNPVADSTVVYFTCDEGVIRAHEARTEDELGLAFTDWLSYGSDPGDDGIIILIAETSGGNVIDSGTFINSWYPDTMWYTAFPPSMFADGKSKGFMFVEVRDLNLNFVDDLTKIKLEGDNVAFIDRENGDGCFSSGISAYIVPQILDQDYSMTGGADNGIGFVAPITTRSGFFAGVVDTLLLLTGTTYIKQSSIDIVSTAGPGDNIPFSVTIKDRWGNPLGDHTVICTVTSGSITNGTQNTNTYGEAGGYVLTAPGVGGVTITLSAQDIDPRGVVTITQNVTITE